MGKEFIYHMDGLSKKIGAKQILNNIHLSFYPDAKIGIVGVNGSGKSTLLKIMAGVDENFSGDAFLEKGATVGYLPQEPQLDENKNVKDNIIGGLGNIQEKLTQFEKVSLELGKNYSEELMEEMGKLQEEIDAADGWTIDSQVEMAMNALRCPEGDASVVHLSGGEKRRVALAKLLLAKPDLLLLDEPTNHLDAETVAWLEHHLLSYQGAVIIVTHDRYFLDNITSWVLELDRGSGIPFEGNYSAWLLAREKRLLSESKEDTSRLKTISREIEWIRSSPSARRSKSKARISAFDDLVNQAGNVKINTASITIPVSKRLGGKVIEFKKVSKGFDKKLLIDNLSFSLPAGGIIGVIGANGAGKTTLFKMITGEEKVDEGTVSLGDTVEIGYVSQSRENLEGDKSVWEEISGGNDLILLGKQEINSRAYCGWYNFKGADQQKKVKDLSGGERNRLQMAKLLKKGENVLLLDEPTNDLDVETLSSLENALENFAGCAVIITHDRWFLDRLATHILAFEGDSHVEWFNGDYASYVEDKIKRTGSNDEIPKRLQYKKLTRT